ncbi:heat shock protein HslJ [Pseudomonas sp. BIGb0450]|nr:heat shock protein HslJ [Pseudomonas sp. BIGb0558]MCS3438948.1 heat shock protein HslJ [Pseudomonas sp. BIGb0450]
MTDTQVSKDNKFDDTKTTNNAKADGSLSHSSGNLGANIASGSGNQQDNAASITSSADDAASVFAVADIYQESQNNKFTNKGTQNTASLNNSGNNSSGNAGINAAAGQGNQQKNNLAIVTADGNNVAAASNTDQQSLDNHFLNEASTTHGYGNSGQAQYVSNNATLTNSGNYSSGNLGINVSAGSGNQQSNTLTLGSGCTQCAAGNGVRF